MEIVELKASIREEKGGRNPKRLRKHDIIPGIVYGRHTEPLSVKVERGALEHALHTSAGENVVINLNFDDKKNKQETTVIVKDIQHDVITDKINHVDFHVISLTEKVIVKVHIHPKGEAEGVKEGGILDVIHHEVEIKCLPTQIPSRIDVNISGLKINDSLHIKDLVLPEGVECLEDPESVLLVILAPKVEEEVTEAEVAEGEEEITEPEVIKKGKEEVTEEEEKAAE